MKPCLYLAVGLCLALMGPGCGRSATTQKVPSGISAARSGGATYPIELPQVETRAGTAIAILIDTSGSMVQGVPDRGGQLRPKDTIARAALERIIEQTAGWKKAHPDRVLMAGIYNFSSSVGEVLPMADFDAGEAREALKAIPRPNSGTAIGVALEQGAKALYGTGCARKYIVCITDGENTSGPHPEVVARSLHEQTKGDVELHFVAFDTSAAHFNFLKNVNGHVVQANDGARLDAELTKIYEQRILVEKEDPPR